MRWLLIVAVVVVGMLQPVQAGMNAELRRHLAHPFQSAVWNMCFGALVLVALTVVLGIGLPSPAGIMKAPFWSLGGGLIGACIVTTMLIGAKELGAALMIAIFVCGQLASSTAIDHHGWIGYAVREVSLPRVLGIALIVIGVILVERAS